MICSLDSGLRRNDEFEVIHCPHRHKLDLGHREIIEHGWDILGDTAPFDMTGNPAISIPCGKSEGLPMGLMLVGRNFEDATLIQADHAFEQHVDWETI